MNALAFSEEGTLLEGPMADYVLTQDISSGRVHKRYRAESGYATHEADNLDSAGAYRIIGEGELTAIPRDHWCQRCWPSEDDPAARQEDPE